MRECWGVADDGVHVHVEGDRLDQLGEIWPPVGLRRTAAGGDPVGRSLSIRSRGSSAEAAVDGAPAAGGWDRIESELALFAAERLSGVTAIHAAVVVADERALILPGPSHAGKSSLARAAVRAGATVTSDEFALVSIETGLVSGWRRPLRLRRPDGSVQREDVVVDHPPVAAGLVALLSYDGSGDDRWDTVSPSDAVLRILANTVPARTRPDESFDVACRLAEQVAVVEGTRGDADRAIRSLLEELRQGTR